jgi:inorganic pyrophosphatase
MPPARKRKPYSSIVSSLWKSLKDNGYPRASVRRVLALRRTVGVLTMPNFINLPPLTEGGDLHVVVETPRGSRAKFAYDPKLETFVLSKSLLTGLTYPHDWGFVPSTKADDGDPLDIMVIHDAATFPGVVLACRVIGILQIEQKSKVKAARHDRLFAVPRQSHSEQAIRDIRDLSKPIRQELEKFLAVLLPAFRVRPGG